MYADHIFIIFIQTQALIHEIQKEGRSYQVIFQYNYFSEFGY